MHIPYSDVYSLPRFSAQVIVSAMRESHRVRSMFKKVDGFRYVMSMLVAMEGCVGDDVKPPWSAIDKQQIFSLIQIIFCTLTVAMRYEPANVKFFKTEVCQYHRSVNITDQSISQISQCPRKFLFSNLCIYNIILFIILKQDDLVSEPQRPRVAEPTSPGPESQSPRLPRLPKPQNQCPGYYMHLVESL